MWSRLTSGPSNSMPRPVPTSSRLWRPSPRDAGKSKIYGLGRLAHKESDRAGALRLELGRLGIPVRCEGDRMEIHGGRVGKGRVDSHKDHRIAMACAVAALRAEGRVAISGASCVAKSYPAFFSELDSLRAAP